MAQYTINYLTGDTETVEADGVEYDAEARDYTFVVGRVAVALAPVANVRSVVRKPDETTPDAATAYPYQEGDVTVLGPEVFVSPDGEVLSWKGSNYSRRTGPMLGKVTG